MGKRIEPRKDKMARYHDLGIKFISIYPDNMKNLDWGFRKKFKKVTGKDLPRKGIFVVATLG